MPEHCVKIIYMTKGRKEVDITATISLLGGMVSVKVLLSRVVKVAILLDSSIDEKIKATSRYPISINILNKTPSPDHLSRLPEWT